MFLSRRSSSQLSYAATLPPPSGFIHVRRHPSLHRHLCLRVCVSAWKLSEVLSLQAECRNVALRSTMIAFRCAGFRKSPRTWVPGRSCSLA